MVPHGQTATPREVSLPDSGGLTTEERPSGRAEARDDQAATKAVTQNAIHPASRPQPSALGWLDGLLFATHSFRACPIPAWRQSGV